ncbi:MAG: hypothetical protein K9K39_00770 [Desulfohalobiaceae bacterium]|nr:hypothetical protein [Desulfohalobiaceae bacterium]
MKQILVIYYSQTGQLNSILNSVLAPLKQDPEFSIEYREIVPRVPYPFPWSAYQFCDVFPEAVAGIPEEMDTVNQDRMEDPDLIILAYTVWYLSPSIPISSFLQSDEAARLLQNRKVLTLIGCRNMWLLAQERVKKQISTLGGQLVGNIALTERTGNLLGILNIATWMLSGEKKPLLGLLPTPGIAEEDISQARRFGELIRRAWTRDRLRLDQAELNTHGAVRIDPALMLMEKRIWPVFQKWSAFIRKKGSRGDGAREKRVYAFMIYLLLAVVILAPFSRLASLLQRLVQNKKIQEEMRYYSLG